MSFNALIADDHGIVRSGIKNLIKNQFSVDHIDEASTENEITGKVKARCYKLIVLDINIPGVDFINIMDWIQIAAPDSFIIVFSMYAEEIYGKRCLQMGARGYIRKTAADEEILQAIKTVLSGEIYISNEMQIILSQSQEEKKDVNPFEKLSSRELEIALLINKGYTLPQICSLLNIQYSTANTYKRRVFEKLEVHNAVSLSQLMMAFNITT